MPKYRKLHVKAVESWDINDMPDDFTRLLWIMLPLGLCREGRGVDNPAWIKAKTMPLRLDVTPEMITTAMNWYCDRDMIRRYQVNDRKYFYIVTWHEHQGSTIKEAESIYPPPTQEEQEGNSGVSPEQVRSKSGTDAHGDAHGDADATAPDQLAPDPPKNVEALRIYRGETRKKLLPTWALQVEATVGTDSEALRLWESVCRGWCGAGYNPGNIAGMLDCYSQGKIPGQNSASGHNAATGPPQQSQPTVISVPKGDPEWMQK